MFVLISRHKLQNGSNLPKLGPTQYSPPLDAAAANGGICLAFAVCLSRKCTFMYELSSHSFDPYFSSIFSLSKWGTKLGDFKKCAEVHFTI